MGAFFLGILVGWAIEWVFFTYFWKRSQGEANAETASEIHKDCEKEHQELLMSLKDKDRDISHLHARIANLQEVTDRSARQQASAEKSAATASSVPSKAEKQKAKPKPAAPKPATAKAISSKPVTQPVIRPAPRKSPAGKDDLKKVSGIGPKIFELMRAEGIDSFAELAKSDMATLKSILEKAGTRYATADPQSWPKQAELLNSGDKEGLEKLIAELRK